MSGHPRTSLRVRMETMHLIQKYHRIGTGKPPSTESIAKGKGLTIVSACNGLPESCVAGGEGGGGGD